MLESQFENNDESAAWQSYDSMVSEALSRSDQSQANENPQAETQERWETPLPVPATLLPVESFSAYLLPRSMQMWVMDIAERMQCPPDFPAVAAIVALSSVAGRKVCIEPKRRDDWRVVPNLWGAVIGRPGVMKSPALAEALKPLDRLQTLASEEHKKALYEHEIALRLSEMSIKAADAKAQKLIAQGKRDEAASMLKNEASNESAQAPALRRFKVTDASVEALGEILIENPWGTLAYRDELNGLLRSLDKEGQEGARAFYLQGYDGNQGYTFDRIMRGRNLNIPAVCISMLGGIQPGKLQTYIHDAVNGGLGDDGLLQRFGLLVWPDIDKEWRNVDRFPDTPAKQVAFQTFERINAMQPGIDPTTGEAAPVVYRFSPDAQDAFDEWRSDFERELRSGSYHPAMESHLSKYRKVVPALALLCALAEGERDVSTDSLIRALSWMTYLKSHALRAYASGTGPQTTGATALLLKIEDQQVADGFKPSDVYLKGWTHLNNPSAVHQATRMLCDLGYLRVSEKKPGPLGGRPSISFRINPALFSRKKAREK